MNWTSIYIKMKWKQQDEQRILEPQYQLNQDNYWGNEVVKSLDIFIMNKVIYPQQSACMYFFHNAFSSLSLTELFFSWIWEHVALKSNRERSLISKGGIINKYYYPQSCHLQCQECEAGYLIKQCHKLWGEAVDLSASHEISLHTPPL